MVVSKILCAVIFLACAVRLSVTQTAGCKGRCGAEYYRGYMCQCDYNCLLYGECCEDYEAKCTTTNSCMGRCGEAFKRGRLCSCDPDCMKYKQCCPDFKAHCDAEEISGAASAAAPAKTNSCNNVNDNKPKEPTQHEGTKQPSLNQENNADEDIIPLDSPTAYPPDDLTDDTSTQTLPSGELSNNGAEDPEASPVPESSSGYGLPTTDPLDQAPIEPTLVTDTVELTTERVYSQTEVISDDDNLFYYTTKEPMTDADLTASPDQDTAPLEPADYQTSALIPETVPATSTSSPEITTSTPPSDEPEVTAADMQDSNTTPASVLDSTAIPEDTTSDSNAESNAKDVTTVAPSTTSPPTTSSDLDTAMINNSTDSVAPEVTTADPQSDTLKPTSPPDSEPTTKPQGKRVPSKLKPTPKPEAKPMDPQTLTIDDTRDYQGDDSNDTNLCSGRPVSGVTTLRNGTIVVFRGHYFWFLDRNRVPSPAQGITAVWGVPSPIDTVFTRCNCQGKTYIFKGGRYWRFENDVLDSGYPRVIKTGFDGLQGHITAALSVPQYRSRRESVYFFKRGGFVQKYSYQFGTSPKCGRDVNYSIYSSRIRKARQAVSVLGPSINIRTSWRGFPSAVTAAVSVPSNTEPDGYKYYVFSRSKPYNVQLNGERPVIAAPKGNTSPQTNSFIKCPRKS